jgi:chromosome segregation ATPase
MATQTTATTTAKGALAVPTPEIYQQRLSAGLGLAGGARGSLTRTVGKLTDWQQQQQQQAAETTDKDDGESSRDNLVRELQLMELEMTKLILMHQRQELELREASKMNDRNGDDELATNRAAVEELLDQTKQAASTQSCLTEYESLAVLAVQRHPVSSRALQDQLKAVQDEYKETEKALAKATADVAVRNAQFQSLMQTLLDLKQSLTEPLEQTTTTKPGDADDDKPLPMDIEPGEKVEEDAELYGDL